jgi:hypothetical protein
VRRIEGRFLYHWQIRSAKTKVTKTKTALKQETLNLTDLKPDPHCGYVELGDGNQHQCHTIESSTPSNSKFTTRALHTVTLQLVAHLGTFVLLALERFFLAWPSWSWTSAEE